jgi:hypothetical protein
MAGQELLMASKAPQTKRLTSRKGVDMTNSGEKIFEIACGCFIVISLATGLFLLFK